MHARGVCSRELWFSIHLSGFCTTGAWYYKSRAMLQGASWDLWAWCIWIMSKTYVTLLAVKRLQNLFWVRWKDEHLENKRGINCAQLLDTVVKHLSEAIHMTHFPEMFASVLDSCQQELELLRKEFVCSKVNDARSAVYSEFSRKLCNTRVNEF